MDSIAVCQDSWDQITAHRMATCLGLLDKNRKKTLADRLAAILGLHPLKNSVYSRINEAWRFW